METLKGLPVGGGLKVKYRIHHAGGLPKRVVVLLHGVASNMTRWSEFVERTSLKDSWDTLRLDLRGHGESPWRGRLDMETWCRDLLAVLDAEQYDQAVFIGHSLGAQIAINFANRHPSRTAGLVLIDPILGGALLGHLRAASRFIFLLKTLVFVIRFFNRIGIYRRHIPCRDLRALDERIREELLSEGKIEEMVKRYSSIKPDIEHFPTANFLQEIIQMVRPLPDLSGISAPVLVLLSNGVTYTDPEATRDNIARFQKSTTVSINAHHWPLTEKPDEVRLSIESWMTTLKCG